jgi:hypothetical protein
MKKLFITTFALISSIAFNQSFAQCTPGTLTSPGISPTASEGIGSGSTTSSFSANVTFRFGNAPTSVRLGDLVDAATLAQSPIPLDPNTQLPFEADYYIVSVEGLPTGLNFACNVGNCEYDDNVTGCVSISGTPSVGGVFEVTVTANYYGTATGLAALSPFPGLLPDQVPVGGTLTIPGIGDIPVPPYQVGQDSYSLSIDGPASINEVFNSNGFKVSGNFPNPFSNYTDINVFSAKMSDINVIVRDINGREVKNIIMPKVVGDAVIRLNADKFDNGVYICEVNNGISVTSFKMIVSK